MVTVLATVPVGSRPEGADTHVSTSPVSRVVLAPVVVALAFTVPDPPPESVTLVLVTGIALGLRLWQLPALGGFDWDIGS